MTISLFKAHAMMSQREAAFNYQRAQDYYAIGLFGQAAIFQRIAAKKSDDARFYLFAALEFNV